MAALVTVWWKQFQFLFAWFSLEPLFKSNPKSMEEAAVSAVTGSGSNADHRDRRLHEWSQQSCRCRNRLEREDLVDPKDQKAGDFALSVKWNFRRKFHYDARKLSISQRERLLPTLSMKCSFDQNQGKQFRSINDQLLGRTPTGSNFGVLVHNSLLQLGFNLRT